MTILCLCREDNLTNTLAEYARAIRTCGVRLECVERGTPLNADLGDLLKACAEEPAAILQPESDFPLLPQGLAQTQIPTICFQVDTYAFPKRRLRWASLFDHVAVFHPGYVEEFRRGGHPGAFLLPHAVRRELFEGGELERTFDLGWVGQSQGPLYRRRAALLPALAGMFKFKMNEWDRKYSAEELAEVYRRSRIVVNIGRDDYPQDANLRTFEAMAAGALLLTSQPTELTRLGFEDGVHFIGYRNPQEITILVREYLAGESARRRIADAGREKVLRQHTYDCRVKTLLARLEQDAGKLFAPARKWSEGRVRLTYLDFFAAHGALDCATAELRQIARRSLRNAMAGASLIARAWARQSRGRLAALVQRNP